MPLWRKEINYIIQSKKIIVKKGITSKILGTKNLPNNRVLSLLSKKSRVF
jgi:hypothetical protein